WREAPSRLPDWGPCAEGAVQPPHLALRADHRTRLERDPEKMPVGSAQAEILDEPAAALLQHVIERGAKAVAVMRMQHIEPARGRSFERAAPEAEQGLGLRAGEDLVDRNVPVPDHVARPADRQRSPPHLADDPLRQPTPAP